jgi:hypothetical protein
MAVAHAAPMDLPVARVRDREFLHESPQVAVVLGPQHEVPMVGQQAIREDPHGTAFRRLFQHLLERFEIGVLQEQPHPSHAAIQDVKQHSARS